MPARAATTSAGPAARTGEWRKGIARLLDDPPAALADYVGLVRSLGLYPGSPAITRALLRPDDRLACCELHPEDAAALRRHFAGDRQVAVHHRDAWEALGALLPPKERRGLVLIDPPFEDPHEFAQLARGLATGWQRFRTGVFAAWYPIKQRAPVRQFLADLRRAACATSWPPNCACASRSIPRGSTAAACWWSTRPTASSRRSPAILAALLDRLGDREPGEGAAVTRIADE